MGDTKAQEEDGNLFLLSLPPPPSPSSSRSLSSSSLFCQSKVRSTFRVRRPLRPIPAFSVALSPHLSLSPSPSYTPARFCFLAGLWCESRRNGGNVAETGGVSGERRKIPPSVSGTNESIATEHRRARGRVFGLSFFRRPFFSPRSSELGSEAQRGPPLSFPRWHRRLLPLFDSINLPAAAACGVVLHCV